MKKYLLWFFLGFFLIFSVFAEENTELLELEEEIDIDTLPEISFELQEFNSCEAMTDTLFDFFKNNRSYYSGGYYRGGDVLMEQSDGMMMPKSVPNLSIDMDMWAEESIEATNISTTNTQVLGVDESEMIKTDGEYVYYVNNTQSLIYIARIFPKDSLEVVKKISLPKTLSGVQLYLREDQLIIIGNRYKPFSEKEVHFMQRDNYVNDWFNQYMQTFVAVYDISHPESAALLHARLIDGELRKSRVIDNNLYLISQNRISIPYWRYETTKNVFGAQISNFDEDAFEEALKERLSSESFLPKQAFISPESDPEKFTEKNNKKIPYSYTSRFANDCKNVSYLLPDEETQQKYNITPSIVTLSTIDLDDLDTHISSEIIIGNISEIYMSTENMYLTSHIYTESPFRCPVGSYCILPYFQSRNSTLIHKFSLENQKPEYDNSGIVPGSPLTQYSLDEYEGDFRIITNTWYPERQTSLYILDKNMELKGSISDIAPGEDFKSSRYIGDKLFLVTFEQIDPLFVIDMEDASNPEIIGELKIPGYSTYLHPYGSQQWDIQYLIGLGQGTYTNEWGGTRNGGVKVDVYVIDYSKNETAESKCITLQDEEEYNSCVESVNSENIEVRNTASYEIGISGSSSEALYNPRMFVFNSQTDTLLLPAKIYEWENGDWNKRTAWQGMLEFSLEKNKITLENKFSHIDMDIVHKEREKKCEKYTAPKEEEVCRTLLDGSVHCSDPSEKYRYIPEYCYSDSTDETYLAQNLWNFDEYFVKRSLFLDDYVYSLSDSMIQLHDTKNNYETKEILFK